LRIAHDGGGWGDGSGGGGGPPSHPEPEPEPDLEKRPLGPALRCGLHGLCPACGEGALFEGHLKVVPVCAVCGEELFHHRADDLPPYLTILVVGHVVIAALLFVERNFRLDPMTEAALFLPGTALFAIWVLKPIKGAVVAWQWALRMHGFGRRRPAEPPVPPPEAEEEP
jgi:uncharacterized protein (DUF983 family)